MADFMGQLGDQLSLTRFTVPDLWQQEAVAALRSGKDVVVQAPTGAGKTLIFELWSNQGRNRGQAIYTVPTRALANDKLAEWRGQGWNVGIATGDLVENLEAPVVVATLETQKNRLIREEGPALLVVDECQMIGDADRGLNYELALALAPARTQLLLMSGSVGNPQDLVKWLERLGRDAVLVRHDIRPVPLEEVHAGQMSYRVPAEVKGYWPRLVTKALAEDLGPVLIFAPRRQATEKIAAELGRHLPNPNPLELSQEQRLLVGEPMATLLKSRVAYHHSGLSYAARAGVVEPLAKAGQLRAVVATMGLAAGINFSLRSVALAGESYRRDHAEQPLRADEILQMFGRAGRRGIDEVGYVIVTSNGIGLREAYPAHLSRSGLVDWAALLGLMGAAAAEGLDPFAEAVRVQQRLFTTRPIFLGVEESLKHPRAPCGLATDPERARHVRKRIKEMRNSRGEWERMPKPELVPAGRVWVQSTAGRVGSTGRAAAALGGEGGAVALRPALAVPEALEKVGHGVLTQLSDGAGAEPVYGRELTVAELLNNDRVLLVKWVRRMTGWRGRQLTLKDWKERGVRLVEEKLAEHKTPVVRMEHREHRVVAHVSLAELEMRVPVDSVGVGLWRPELREVVPDDCAGCGLTPVCRKLSTATGVAMLWRRLGLVEPSGVPTWRGKVVSFFTQEDGLAIAASLEDEGYELEELIYDLANLDAGFRFCGEENRWAGRMILACHERYGMVSVPGYLENGAPPRYGAGAEQIVASVHRDPASKQRWLKPFLGPGDIDRVIIEWRSILRQIAHAPDLDWERWRRLQSLARGILNETSSPTITDLPPLSYEQSRRVDHRLHLRRH